MTEILLAVLYFLFGKTLGNSKVWNLMAILYLGIWLSKVLFGVSDAGSFYYTSRTVLTFFIASYMMRISNSLSRYQLIWIISSLILYLGLHLDMMDGGDRVYSNYEAICYGIITFQLLGVFHGIVHRLWCGFLNRLPNSSPIVQFDKDDARQRSGDSDGGGRINTNRRNNRRGNSNRPA